MPPRDRRTRGAVRALVLAGVLVAATTSSGCLARDSALSGKKRSVLWIVLDACRADHLSSYGYARETTPNIDRLAARGALFENNFAQAPSTLPSVPSYLTGRRVTALYQDAHHMLIWFLRRPLPDERLVSTIFSDNGYATVAFSGSPWYSRRSRLGLSFDEFVSPTRETDDAKISLGALNPRVFTWLDANADRPFFAYVHAMDTHSPHPAVHTDGRWIDGRLPVRRQEQLRRWDTVRHLNAGERFSDAEKAFLAGVYDGALRAADTQIGSLLAKLTDLGLDESTIVVISSDHGELLGENGLQVGHPAGSDYDELFHTPLIIAGPGVARGVRVAAATENTDIVPTLVELAGLTTDAGFDGSSLISLVERRTRHSPHEYIFARTKGFGLTAEPARVYTAPDHKVVLEPRRGKEGRGTGSLPRSLEQVFARPDRITDRQPLQRPGLIAKAKRYDARVFLPAWRAQEAAPEQVPSLFVLPLPVRFGLSAQVARRESATDGRWGVISGPRATFFDQDWLVIARPYREQVADLEVQLRSRPGRYRVEVFSLILDEPDRPRDTSFEIKAEGQSGFTRYQIEARGAPGPDGSWLEIGEHDVGSDGFRFTVRPGSSEANAVIGSVRFRDVHAAGPTATAPDLWRERAKLRALGYFD